MSSCITCSWLASGECGLVTATITVHLPASIHCIYTTGYTARLLQSLSLLCC